MKMFGVGSIPWSPLARGVLTRPLSEQKSTTRAQTDQWISIYTGSGTPDIVNRFVVLSISLNYRPERSLDSRVEEIAKKKGATMAQIAIAWSLSKPGVTAPIVGTTSLKNLEDIIGKCRRR